MPILIKFHFIISGFIFLLFFAYSADASTTIDLPSGIDHTEFSRILNKYVNTQGLVNYQSWKKDERDQIALNNYLLQYADVTEKRAEGREKVASLINAYNAFTLQWILENYPTESIRALPNSWTEKRHIIGGKKVSLDEIEHDNLRPLIGWRVHSAIVCAARSCPPLQPTAYTIENLDMMIDAVYSQWLSNPVLNTYYPEKNEVELSLIFKWFEDDFKLLGGVKKILVKYSPKEYQVFLVKDNYKINFRDYHWGLNDQSSLGENYHYSIFKSLF
jgi:hypothetical protein